MRSLSAGMSPIESPLIKKPDKLFLSTPYDLHTKSTHRNHTPRLRLTNTEIVAMSAQDIVSSDFIFEQKQEGTRSAPEILDSQNMKRKVSSLNWRLAYNPRCIMLGISTLLQVSAITAAYPCIPPLGEQTGNIFYVFLILRSG